MTNEIEKELRAMIFGKEPAFGNGMAKEGQHLYRKLVRNNLYGAVSSQLSLTAHHAGETRFHFWFSEWLSEAAPCERIYWKLPIEFALWLRENANENDRLFAELAHFEAMQISSVNAPNDSGAHSLNLSSESQIQLHPSCRLSAYHYPVYQIQKNGDAHPTHLQNPNFILLYRSIEDVHWMILEPQVAQLMAQFAEGLSVGGAFDFIKKLYPDADLNYLRSQLVRLNRLHLLWTPSSCAE